MMEEAKARRPQPRLLTENYERYTKNLTNSHDFETPWSSLGPNITMLFRILT